MLRNQTRNKILFFHRKARRLKLMKNLIIPIPFLLVCIHKMSSQNPRTLEEIAGKSVDFYEQIKETATIAAIRQSIKKPSLGWLGELIYDTIEDWDQVDDLEDIVHILYAETYDVFKVIAEEIKKGFLDGTYEAAVIPEFLLGNFEDTDWEKIRLDDYFFHFVCRYGYRGYPSYPSHLEYIDLVRGDSALECDWEKAPWEKKICFSHEVMEVYYDLTYQHLKNRGLEWEAIDEEGESFAECQGWYVGRIS